MREKPISSGTGTRTGGEGLQAALDAVLADVVALGGNGGLIAVLPSGAAAWGFTTPGMYRAMARDGAREVHVFGDLKAQ